MTLYEFYLFKKIEWKLFLLKKKIDEKNNRSKMPNIYHIETRTPIKFYLIKYWRVEYNGRPTLGELGVKGSCVGEEGVCDNKRLRFEKSVTGVDGLLL